MRGNIINPKSAKNIESAKQRVTSDVTPGEPSTLCAGQGMVWCGVWGVWEGGREGALTPMPKKKKTGFLDRGNALSLAHKA